MNDESTVTTNPNDNSEFVNLASDDLTNQPSVRKDNKGSINCDMCPVTTTVFTEDISSDGLFWDEEDDNLFASEKLKYCESPQKIGSIDKYEEIDILNSILHGDMSMPVDKGILEAAPSIRRPVSNWAELFDYHLAKIESSEDSMLSSAQFIDPRLTRKSSNSESYGQENYTITSRLNEKKTSTNANSILRDFSMHPGNSKNSDVSRLPASQFALENDSSDNFWLESGSCSLFLDTALLSNVSSTTSSVEFKIDDAHNNCSSLGIQDSKQISSMKIPHHRRSDYFVEDRGIPLKKAKGQQTSSRL